MNYESYLDLMKGSFTIIVLALCSIYALKLLSKSILPSRVLKKDI